MRIRAAAAVLACWCSGCSGSPRDAVPPTRDVVVDAGGPARPTTTGYEYVARRRFAIVALAEARGIDAADVRAAVEKLADGLDACAATRPDGGARSPGAARIVAHLAPNGTVAATNVRIDPGADVTETALLCLLAPIRALAFAASRTSTRGFAIEALWGPVASAVPDH